MKKLLTSAATLLAAGAGVAIATPFGQNVEPQGATVTEGNDFPTVVVTRPDNLPMRTTSGGTNLFGFLSDWTATPEDWIRSYRGVYEIGEYGEVTKVYTDPAASLKDRFTCAFLLDGYLYGYADAYFDENFNQGTPKFLKVNFETGQVIESMDIEATDIWNGSWVSPPAYNPEDGYFYFCSNEFKLCRATIANPSAVEIVKQYNSTSDNIISLAYCPEDKRFYGINVNNKFISIDTDGTVTPICDIPDKGSHGTYQAAMTWSPRESVFYWDYIDNGYPSVSNLYTITREGTFNLECTLDDGSCFDWFVTPDVKFIPAAPESPVISAIDFPAGALSGKLVFTMPLKMQNGNDLPSSVSWAVTLDGEDYKSGAASPGSEVEVEFTDLTTGNHEFGITASIDAFRCDPVTRRIWIGYDTPMAPANVTLTETGISWEAPTAGIHAGYVDFSVMKYNVKIINIFGNTVFSQTTSDTSLTYTLDNPEELYLYTAVVTAESNGLVSAEANSAGLVMGDAMTPPVHFAPTPAEFGLMTLLDKNNDGIGWSWNSERNAILAGYSDTKAMDDYLFLPAMYFASAERIYEFSLDASAWSPNFSGEYLDVVLATEPNYDGVIESIADRTQIACSYDLRGNLVKDYQNLKSNFSVIEPGIYYIGIHCSSEANMSGILVKNINVEDGGVLNTSPDVAENITATPASDGVLQATVTFNFPSQTVEGDEIPTSTKLTATISTSEQTVTAEGMPGTAATVTVATVQGENEISIVISNDRGENSPRAIAKVFTGQTVPAYVTNVRGMISDDMLEFTLYWDAPTEGANGGYIDPSQLTYNIYVYDPTGILTNWVPVTKGLTDCQYTFRPEEQDYYRLAIEAVNVAGASSMVSGSAWAGPAYTLPYSDNFSNSSTIYETKPWQIFTNGYNAEWSFIRLKDINSDIFGSDNDKVAMYCCGVEGTVGRVSMPRFSTLNEDDATLSLDVYTGSLATAVNIYAYSGNDNTLTPLGSLPVNQGNGINTVSFKLPASLLGKYWVQVLIEPEISAEGAFFAMTRAAVNNGSGVCLTEIDGQKAIIPTAGGIRISGHEGDNLTISTADGITVASGKIESGNAFYETQPGIYVVKAGNHSVKVTVK